MKKRRILGFSLLVVTLGIYGLNASWIAGVPDGEMMLVSHRGVHQTFSREGLTNETCTAERIYPPSHTYIENTLASFAAAIDYGAEIIELDIHPTTDGEFVVFHDWTLDCRTDGSGRTRDYDLATLKALDIGYGYTADQGQTFPLRGKYTGAMPTLNEVLSEFPDIPFIINIKSRSETEADALLSYVAPKEWARLSISGHINPLSVIRASKPDIIALSRTQAKKCLKAYAITGWYGGMPKACHNAYVPVPSNYRRLMWGWPHRFEKRLNAVGSRSLLRGPLGGVGTTGIDDLETARIVPLDYKGLIWVNKIEVVGPVLNQELE